MRLDAGLFRPHQSPFLCQINPGVPPIVGDDKYSASCRQGSRRDATLLLASGGRRRPKLTPLLRQFRGGGISSDRTTATTDVVPGHAMLGFKAVHHTFPPALGKESSHLASSGVRVPLTMLLLWSMKAR